MQQACTNITAFMKASDESSDIYPDAIVQQSAMIGHGNPRPPWPRPPPSFPPRSRTRAEDSLGVCEGADLHGCALFCREPSAACMQGLQL